MTESGPLRVLVTGGGGFLGQALCRLLVTRGHDVTSLNRGRYPALDELGVRQVRGDIADCHAVLGAAEGMDAVVHTAAKAGVWGRADEFHQVNVVGTANVIESCRSQGVSRLVHTSTPSVAHSSRRPVEGGTAESVPCAAKPTSQYAKTKLAAEKLVLAANGDSLSTVALRPRLIWGPGDNQLVPRLAARASAGRLRLVGGGHAVVDTTYIDNAAQAHLDALERLRPGAACAGRAYFISNGEPRPVRDILNALLRAVGAPETNASVPRSVAYAAGALSEAAWLVFRLSGEPPLTRFLAEQLATTHWYDLTPARRDLGYEPAVSIDEGLRRLAAASVQV